MAKSEGTGTPLDLSYSLIVIVIPGAFALAPFGLGSCILFPKLFEFYDEHQATANVVLFAFAVLVGLIFENLGTHFEVRWDDDLEDQYAVQENWYGYLARVTEHEPVAYDYIKRMVTNLYFELSMTFAIPCCLVGLALVLAWEPAPLNSYLVRVPLLALGLAFTWFFYVSARSSHEVLCKTRREVNKRLDVQAAAASGKSTDSLTPRC
jgi:hypothetical protein